MNDTADVAAAAMKDDQDWYPYEMPLAKQRFSNHDLSAPPKQHSCVTQHSFLICTEVSRPCCRLPDQPINVTVDSSSLALIHSLTKYLYSLAPGWDLGQGYTVRWPPCVYVHTTSPSPDPTSNLSVFQTNYTMGCASLLLKDTLVIYQ